MEKYQTRGDDKAQSVISRGDREVKEGGSENKEN